MPPIKTLSNEWILLIQFVSSSLISIQQKTIADIYHVFLIDSEGTEN
jgi:hypothetical protein